MKKISFLLAFLLVFSLFAPVTNAYAYDAPNQKGYVTGNQVVSGTLSKNAVGNAIPDEYTLVIVKNSIVRIQAMTISNNFSLELDCPNNPSATSGSYSSLKGDAVTKVGDYYFPSAQILGTTGIGVASDKRNVNPYTEVFTNLIAGTYKVRVSGGPDYQFKIIVDPYMFEDDDSTLQNGNIYSAKKISMEVPQDGNIISNGVKEGKIISDDLDKIGSDFYQFSVPKKGMYIAKITTDGFYQGTLEVRDSSGKFLHDGKVAVELSLGGKEPTVVGTYEQHKAFAGKSYAVEFEAETSGNYYLQVTKKNSTAGSYQIVVNSVQPGLSTLNPYGTPSVEVKSNTEALLDSIKISPQDPNVNIGSVSPLRLNAIYTNKNVVDVTIFTEWSSSDSNIATVDAAGQIKGISEGTVIIKATLDGKSTETKVTVTAPSVLIKKIVPLKEKIYLTKGKTVTNKIFAYFSDGTKKDVTGATTLKVTGNSVVIQKNNTVKGVKKGTSKITVTYGNVSAVYTIVVK